MRLADLAARLGCTLESAEASAGHVDVSRVCGLDEAGAGDISFLANPKYARQVADTRASAVIAGPELTAAPCPVIRSAHPYLTFAEAVRLLNPAPASVAGVHPSAVVDPSASVAPDASVGPFVAIGANAVIGARTVVHPHVAIGRGAVIGADCLIHAQVSIREGVVIGDRVILQDAAVIGSDGFGFAKRADGAHEKIPQVGRVVIESDVEIGAHTAVDRPAVGETRIAAGTKIDNLVQVAHGVKIGRRALLAAQSGIAGSTTVGDDVVFAGQSGAVGHVDIGQGSVITAKSAVTHDLPPGSVVGGFPAVPLTEWKKSIVALRHLAVGGRPARRRVKR